MKPAVPAVGPVVVTSRSDLGEARAEMAGTVAFVPTMGALHEGHRSLLRRARDQADQVVVSIFVNPLQFGPNEDLDRYPRTLESDLAMCAAEGVALAFVPTREQMYPTELIVTVSAGALGERFEGASRPGHFDGVLTVVAKLFGLLRPDVAVFGRKDAQQLALVRRMVVDLDLPVVIDGAPIVRETDGLALSSRNRYLSADQRVSALALSKGLAAGASIAASANGAVSADGAADVTRLLDGVRAVLDDAAGVVTDYVALVDPDDFTHRESLDGVASLLLVAAKVGSTRLIDNASINSTPIERG